MTIDEAIAHAEWCAENSCGECAEDHRQLAEWLKDLRERKSTDAALEDERNLLSERLGDYREALIFTRAENAKLRVLIVDAVEVAEDYYHCAGVKDDLDAIKGEMRELGIEVEE